jgi:transcriptional regulator with PAS, ATPase and Fis domain
MSEAFEATSAQHNLYGDNSDPASASLLGTMLGSSHAMVRLDDEITRIAASNHIVLITGESGTGKTTAAQMIHHRSPRARGRLVDINCAAIPDTLLESELFGFEKGAFTGALREKKGLFEVASGGTLFLDEVGELKLDLQGKLLKAIEQKQIRRVGGTNDILCDVRILAASSRNLQRMVRLGSFREDLYYRLAVLEIVIPPLRDRREDIGELIKRQVIEEQRNVGLSDAFQLEDRALDQLKAYSWPGNIRQLHNVLARLTWRAIPSRKITVSDVRAELDRFQELDSDIFLLPDSCRTILPGESLEVFTVRVRAAAIETVKARLGGRISQAADRLKVDRSSLIKIVNRLNAFTGSKSVPYQDPADAT